MDQIAAGKSYFAKVLVLACLIGGGCGRAAPPAAGPLLRVKTVELAPEDVPLVGEWVSTLDGTVNAFIKAQVTGYLLKQVYDDGTFVTRGQVLFEIDARPFQAALDLALAGLAQADSTVSQANSQLLEAKAQVLRAEAQLGKTRLDVARYTPLVQAKAVTEQELDNAVQSNRAAQAEVEAAEARFQTAKAQIVAAAATVEAAKAGVATARLNMGFTQVTSPIDGIAGAARSQIGTLVNAGADVLTVVSSVDPIKAFFDVNEQDYLRYTRAHPELADRQARVRQTELILMLSDGEAHPHKGRIIFADREVNARTGSIRLAGSFPNPGHALRPGIFGRIRATMEVKKGALLVPERAVIDLQGATQVAIVGADGTLRIQAVRLGERIGSRRVVTEGVKAGDRVVVEGLMKIRGGMKVEAEAEATDGKKGSSP